MSPQTGRKQRPHSEVPGVLGGAVGVFCVPSVSLMDFCLCLFLFFCVVSLTNHLSP